MVAITVNTWAECAFIAMDVSPNPSAAAAVETYVLALYCLVIFSVGVFMTVAIARRMGHMTCECYRILSVIFSLGYILGHVGLIAGMYEIQRAVIASRVELVELQRGRSVSLFDIDHAIDELGFTYRLVGSSSRQTIEIYPCVRENDKERVISKLAGIGLDVK